jgi:hypothetical protein
MKPIARPWSPAWVSWTVSEREGSVVAVRQRLQHDDEQGEAHRELREDVVKGDSEGEVQPMDVDRARHGSVLPTRLPRGVKR